MTQMFDTVLSCATLVGVLLLLISAGAAVMLGARRMRLVPVPVSPRKQKRHLVYQGQQLEARQLLDAGLGAEASQLEGESLTIGGVTYDNVDFIALAKAIADSGTKFFGADWCPYCTSQKGLFGEGASYLPFIEASTPDHQLNPVGVANNITTFPTWVFPDGSRLTGEQSIETILQRSGVSVPTGEALYLAEIADQIDLTAGQSFYIPLDGYSPSGKPLTYTVTTASGIVETTVLQGNRSLRIHSNRFGTMEFYLFEDLAPNATSRIIELAEDGFYDGIPFHRVISGFMFQGGDPNGNGSGGSSLPDFDDQFHPLLRHNTPGLLSMAKSQDDTNNSQFFVLDDAAPWLDFQHTIFGMLTEGDKVRQSINGTPVNANDVPKYPVAMNTVEVFTDTENGVLRLTLPKGVDGEETVTVTVSDGDGNTVTRTFQVTFEAPESDSTLPYLGLVPDVTMQRGGTYSFKLSAIDVDGGTPIFYDKTRFEIAGIGVPQLPQGLTYSVNSSTGMLQISANSALAAGTYNIYVGVSNTLTSTSNLLSQFDIQMIEVTVADRPELNPDTFQVTEDQVAIFNPLTNDTSATGDIDPSTLRLLSQPAAGELTVDPETGEMTYTPPADYNGTVSFQYVVANEHGLLGAATTVTLVVAPVNDPPQAYDDRFVASRDTSVMLPVLRNDDKGAPDEADDPVTLILPEATTANGGTLVVVGDQILYTPAAGFTGTDVFTYVMDDDGMETSAVVAVEVRETSHISLTAVVTPTSVDSHGHASSTPQSDQVIGEWSSFWIEIWGTAEDAITGASATLHFDPTMYRANSITLGPGVIAGSGNTVNNNQGTARLNVTASGSELGTEGPVLLGRVRFTPLASGLAAPQAGDSLSIDFSQFLTSISNVSLTVQGGGQVSDPTADATVQTRLLPMVYDLNDDGRVDLADFSRILQTWGNSQSTAFIDFDLSGDVADAILQFQKVLGTTYNGGVTADAFSPALLQAASGNTILASSFAESPAAGQTLGVESSLGWSSLELGPLAGGAPVTVHVVDLPGTQLGKTVGNSIFLDRDAAGWGWFIDTTPYDDHEFSLLHANGNRQADVDSAAAGKMDLLSVLLHELGHIAGWEHTADGLMTSRLLPGQRLVLGDALDLDDSFYIAAVDQVFLNEEE